MKKKSDYTISKKVAEICLDVISKDKHLSILQEMYGFDGILNFSQTIKELIMIDQMDTFGISKEMQSLLKHINQLKMLSSMANIRKIFQKEYENLHKRTIVLIKIGECTSDFLNQIISQVSNDLGKNCDIIYQRNNVPGIVIQYKDKNFEYTPSSVAKTLKAL